MYYMYIFIKCHILLLLYVCLTFVIDYYVKTARQIFGGKKGMKIYTQFSACRCECRFESQIQQL